MTIQLSEQRVCRVRYDTAFRRVGLEYPCSRGRVAGLLATWLIDKEDIAEIIQYVMDSRGSVIVNKNPYFGKEELVRIGYVSKDHAQMQYLE